MATSLSGGRGMTPATGHTTALKGTGYNQVSMSTLSPEQQQLFLPNDPRGHLGRDSERN
jgi:hypothetical protein